MAIIVVNQSKATHDWLVHLFLSMGRRRSRVWSFVSKGMDKLKTPDPQQETFAASSDNSSFSQMGHCSYN